MDSTPLQVSKGPATEQKIPDKPKKEDWGNVEIEMRLGCGLTGTAYTAKATVDESARPKDFQKWAKDVASHMVAKIIKDIRAGQKHKI